MNFSAAKNIRADEETLSQIVQAKMNLADLAQIRLAIEDAETLANAKGVSEAGALASTLSACNQFPKALDALTVFRGKFPDQMYVQWVAGTILTASGDLRKGESEFRKMAEQPEEIGDASNGRLLLAQSLLFQSKFEEAMRVLTVSSKINSPQAITRNDAIRSLLLAKCYLFTGEPEDALRMLRAVEKQDQENPSNLKLFRNAALIALDAGDVDLATRFARIVSRLASKEEFKSDLAQSFDQQLRGELARRKGDAQAVDLLDGAADLRGDPQNLLSLARYYLEKRNCQRAKVYLDKVIERRGLIIDDFFTPWTIWNEAVELKKRCAG